MSHYKRIASFEMISTWIFKHFGIFEHVHFFLTTGFCAGKQLLFHLTCATAYGKITVVCRRRNVDLDKTLFNFEISPKCLANFNPNIRRFCLNFAFVVPDICL